MSAAVLQRLTDCEAGVRAAVDAGDWERAEALETDFRAALTAVVDQLRSGSPDDVATLRATLEAAARRVAVLRGELTHHQRRLEREATIVATGRRAVAAYAAGERG